MDDYLNTSVNRKQKTTPHSMPRAFLLMCIALICLLAMCTMSACKPTDFFTEVIISPFADTVDENNEEQTIVNNPNASEESSMLSALDWTDDSERSEEVQSIVTYAGDESPTSTLETSHSHFDLNPRLNGALSSDAVQLDFSTPSSVESGGRQTNSDSSLQELLEAIKGALGEAREQSDNNGSGGTGSQTNTQDSGGENASNADNPESGMGGALKVYDPNDAFSEVQHADHVAACGQLAVMVQALGGRGALCAMDEETYSGSGDQGVESSFATIFAGDVTSDFESSALLWSGNGSSSADVKDIDALIEACGEGGVIFYDDSESGYATRFDEAMQQKIADAGIQLVPCNLQTVEGILDAATAIGEALSESSCEQHLADEYVQFVRNTVQDVSDGSLAQDPASPRNVLLTSFDSLQGTGFVNNYIYTALATTYVRGISYQGNSLIDTTGGLLFASNYNQTPLSFWAQAAGAWDRAASSISYSSGESYALLWGYRTGGSSTLGNFSGNSILNSTYSGDAIALNSQYGGTVEAPYGLGSQYFPYLIVDSESTKTSVVAQMNNQGLTYSSYQPVSENASDITSYIGANGSSANVFYSGTTTPSNTVRVNPSGLLGNWMQGTMESVLEAAWLARIYSEPNGDYSPINDYTTEELHDTVTDFYSTFYYHGDTEAAEAAYATVVTDTGGAQ